MDTLCDSYESYPQYRMIRNYRLYNTIHLTHSGKIVEKMKQSASNVAKVQAKAGMDVKASNKGNMVADGINFNEPKPEGDMPIKPVSLAESEMTGSGKKRGRKPSTKGKGKSTKTRSFLDSLLS